MAILVAVLAVVVIVASSAWALRRRSTDDTHSVEGYRQTLSTLQGLGARAATGPRRPQEGVEETPLAPDGEPAGRSQVGGNRDSRLAVSSGLPARRPGFDVATGPPAPVLRDGGARAMRAMARPSRRWPLVLALLCVGAVVGAAVYLTGRTNRPSARVDGSSGAGRPATTGPRAGGKASGAGGSKTHATKPSTPPTTTTPVRYEPQDATATAATYTPPTAAYVVTLSASGGDCWVQVTGATGTVVFSQTLADGASHAVTLSGRVTIELGAPTVVTVSIDHSPVVLPAGYAAPFTMTLSPTSTSVTSAPTAGGGGT